MNEQEEKYLYFAFCIDSFNNAWRILNEIKHQKGNSLVGYAFQFALIEYSKPYKTSYGNVVKHHKLSEEYAPNQHLELHKRILDLRDRFHVHTDFSIRDAKIYVTKTQCGKVVGRSQNIIYGTEEIEHIDDIIDLIEKTLDGMYEQAKHLEDDLPATS